MYGLSGNNLAIGVSLVLRDHFTGRAQAAAAAMQNLTKQQIAAQRQAISAERDMMAGGALIGGLATSVMASWFKVGAAFDYTMKYVSTISDKKGTIGFDKLNDKAKSLGSTTMFTAQQVADGMKYMAMAGQDTESIYNNITAAVNLAGSTMSNIEGKGGAADILTNIMKGFNIKDTQENSNRVADILTSATTGANTNLWDLHEAMKYSVSTASTLGAGIEELAASVMMLGNAGIQGSMAGVAIENMYRYIARAVDETSQNRQGKALASIGLMPEDLKQANGQLKPMAGILQAISGAMNNMPENKGLETVFGYNVVANMLNVRGARAGTKLLQNVGDFEKFVDRLNKSGGLAAKNIGEMMSTPQGRIMEMTSAWETFKISFMEAVAPAVVPFLQMMTRVIDTIRKVVETPIGKWLTLLGSLGTVASTIWMGYRTVLLSLRLLHMDVGRTITTAAATTTNRFSVMTTAANWYARSLERIRALQASLGMAAAGAGIGSYTKTTKNNRKHTSHGGGHTFSKSNTPTGWHSKATSRTGKFLGGMGGKIGGWGMGLGMLGGLGLSMGGEAVGGTTGNIMGMAGDALGFAGSGAMIGSMFGPVGTAVGALVGGLGSLSYSIYTHLNKAEDEVSKAADAVEAANKPQFNLEEWRRKAGIINAMSEGDTMFMSNERAFAVGTDKKGFRGYLNGQEPGPQQQTNITINVDGRKMMERVVQKNEYETLLNLDLF